MTTRAHGRTLSGVALAIVALMTLAAPAFASSLNVSSFPSGAQVWVDGVNTGKVTPMSVSLTEGTHTVTVQIPNAAWRADTRAVTISAGSNDLSVTLLPVLAAGPQGPKGDPGPSGPPGAPGAPGAPGGLLEVYSTRQPFEDVIRLDPTEEGGSVVLSMTLPQGTYVLHAKGSILETPSPGYFNQFGWGCRLLSRSDIGTNILDWSVALSVSSVTPGNLLASPYSLLAQATLEASETVEVRCYGSLGNVTSAMVAVLLAERIR